MTYAKHFRDQKINKKEIMTPADYVSLIEIMLVRSSNYVFGYCRKYLFSDFIDRNTPFDLRNVLKNIANCKDIDKLKKLERTILDLYFPKGN